MRFLLWSILKKVRSFPSPLVMRAMNSSMKRLNVLKGRAIYVWRAITPMARAVAGSAFAKHLAVMARLLRSMPVVVPYIIHPGSHLKRFAMGMKSQAMVGVGNVRSICRKLMSAA